MSTKLAKLKVTSRGPKVDHPLAKYNSKGDLYCLLCNTVIKNANVWKVHLSSKVHKENMILFKSGKTTTVTPTTKTLKRPVSKIEQVTQSFKKSKLESDPVHQAPPRSLKKSTLPNNEESISSTESPINTSDTSDGLSLKSGILKQSSKVTPKLPEGFVPKSRVTKDKPPVDTVRVVEEKCNLPVGFFDDNVVPMTNDEDEPETETDTDKEPEQKKKDNPASNLPDGFFDDAREDAKARKIEYKDPQQVEWEKFQNEMEQEDIRYNTIIEEDDQKLRVERDVDIGFEQKLWDYRVESIASCAESGDICIEDKKAFEMKIGEKLKLELEVKKEEPTEMCVGEQSVAEQTVAAPSVDIKMEDDSESSDNEDDMMDWRTKRGI